MKFNIQSVAAVGAALIGLANAHYVRVRATDIANTDPYDDPFYNQPANINTYQPGAIIDNRTITTDILFNISKALHLKFRTTDNQGKAVSTLATLWVPLFPNKNPGIVAYQYAEDAVQLDCAPSWAWVRNSKSNNANFTKIEGPIVIPWALERGYYVIQPDAYGPNSTLLVGNMEGKAVLDAIRATINFNNLNKTTQIGLYGYSGGAHSTVWATELQPSYAPELNIVGASHGGTPVDLQSAFQIVNGGSEAILVGGGVLGLAQGYPALEKELQTGTAGLTTAGKAVAKQIRARNFCLNNEQDKFAGVDFNQYFKKPLDQNTVLRNVTNRESLLTNVSPLSIPVPKFPRYIYHGTKDVTVPYNATALYVQQQCSNRANIKFMSYNGFNHSGAALLGIFPALGFLGDAFDGKLQNCECGTTNCS